MLVTDQSRTFRLLVCCRNTVQIGIYTNIILSEVRIYKTIILLVVLYGCETWSLTVREEHKLRVFENRV
jgi:hypothetical protein